MLEGRRQRETNMAVPEACNMALKIIAEHIGEIKTVTNYVRQMVNVTKNAAACADVDKMKAHGFPHILCGLAIHVILMVNHDFIILT